jgi:hypothetical protein
VAEGQGAIKALDMDVSSCGFKRARSHPAKIIKGAKAALYPKARCSPQSLARRLASPFVLPAALPFHDVLTVAQQAKANAARVEAKAFRPGKGQFHAAPRLALHLFLTTFASLAAPGRSGCGGETRRP